MTIEPFRAVRTLLAALLSFLAMAAAGAATIEWPDNGQITYVVPAGWTVTVTMNGATAVELTAHSASGANAAAQIAVMTNPNATLANPASGKSAFLQSADRFAADSVEKTTVPKDLNPVQGVGWYSLFTDPALVGKAPVKDNFKCLYATFAIVDTGVFAGGILSFDDPAGPDAAALLELQRSIRFVRAKGVSPGSGGKKVEITKSATTTTVRFPAANIALVLPSGNFSDLAGAGAGPVDNPRYFILADPAEGQDLSGWFESAGKYHGVRDFWAKESTGPGLTDAKHVEFSKVGVWDVVTYDIALGDATSANLRAETVMGTTWIDLHFSMTSRTPTAERQRKQAELLKAIVLQGGKTGATN